jgi:hypothetical protein
MSSAALLPLLALLASVVLLGRGGSKVFSIVATVASGVEVLMAFHVVRLSVPHLGLLLGAALALAGVVLYSKVNAKVAVACATVVALAGVLQVVAAI